jgi:hypothetical protein
MQGHTVPDDAGNPVRIIDYIRGRSLYRELRDLELDHRTYYETLFPFYLEKFTGAVRSIADVHARGQHHGDIRTDHIFVERGTQRFRWIDFDLSEDVSDFDVWSLGNVLLYIVGMGEHTFHDVFHRRYGHSVDEDRFGEKDASAFFTHRIINLKKLFPYIPTELNDVLMHFSFGTQDFYETVEEIHADLLPVSRRLADSARGLVEHAGGEA